MKIAIVSSGLGHIARGVETWADDLAAALHRRGVSVGLFSGARLGNRPYQSTVRCVQRGSLCAQITARVLRRALWRHGWGSPYHIEQETFSWSMVRHLEQRRACDGSDSYDIVHLQDPWLAYRLQQARRRRRHDARIILAHGTEEPLDFLRQFEHVQELSPCYLKRDEEQGIGGRKWYAIPNFVNTVTFSPGDRSEARRKVGLPAEALIVLSVGALRKTRKRMDWLVDEFAALSGGPSKWANHEPPYLVIAGAREEQTAEFVLEARSRLGDRLVVFEDFPRDRMPDLYRAADVFVLCSLEEILGIAFLEAMACGIPSIGHTYPVTEWVIGGGGECIDMNREGMLTAALRGYVSRERRQERGTLARERMVRMFSEGVVVQQILRMYEEVISTASAESHRAPKGAGG